VGRRPLKPDGPGAQGSTLVKDKIIEAIAFEMSEGNWRPYRSVRELAAKYGITLGNAQKWASEATRLLRLSWGQEEAKLAVLERIAQIGRAAETRTEEVVDPKGNVVTVRKPDMATAGKMAVTVAGILGLTGPNSEVVVRYQQMSDADLAREASRFLAQLPGAANNGSRSVETEGEEIPYPEPEREGDEEDQLALGKLVNHRRP